MTDQKRTHKDPTLEAAQQAEIQEKGCKVCQKKREFFDGSVVCGVGKTFPACRRTGGFKLIVDG